MHRDIKPPRTIKNPGHILCSALLVLLLGTLPVLAESACFEGEEGTKLMVEGGGNTSLGQPYRLKVDWYPDSREAEAVDALLVFAEPKHTLMLAHFLVDPHEKDSAFVDSMSPEMITIIEARGESHILGEFEKGLSNSTGFSIEKLINGQLSPLIGETRVPVGSFSIGFLFTDQENSGYKVCCSCLDGCKECETCVGIPPAATCGCPGCDLDCRDE